MIPRLPAGYTKGDDGLYRKTVEFQRPDQVAAGIVSRTTLVRNSQGKLLWSEKTGNRTRLKQA